MKDMKNLYAITLALPLAIGCVSVQKEEMYQEPRQIVTPKNEQSQLEQRIEICLSNKQPFEKQIGYTLDKGVEFALELATGIRLGTVIVEKGQDDEYKFNGGLTYTSEDFQKTARLADINGDYRVTFAEAQIFLESTYEKQD